MKSNDGYNTIDGCRLNARNVELFGTWTDHNGIDWTVPGDRKRLGSKSKNHQALRAYIHFRDHYTCQICGETNTRKLEIDHVKGFNNGGSNHPDNLQVLCQGCNIRKYHRGDE
jgi:5-methylcytosine-specific restriction endonuclease McrA